MELVQVDVRVSRRNVNGHFEVACEQVAFLIEEVQHTPSQGDLLANLQTQVSIQVIGVQLSSVQGVASACSTVDIEVLRSEVQLSVLGTALDFKDHDCVWVDQQVFHQVVGVEDASVLQPHSSIFIHIVLNYCLGLGESGSYLRGSKVIDSIHYLNMLLHTNLTLSELQFLKNLRRKSQ